MIRFIKHLTKSVRECGYVPEWRLKQLNISCVENCAHSIHQCNYALYLNSKSSLTQQAALWTGMKTTSRGQRVQQSRASTQRGSSWTHSISRGQKGCGYCGCPTPASPHWGWPWGGRTMGHHTTTCTLSFANSRCFLHNLLKELQQYY